jgi:hypothetical protein
MHDDQAERRIPLRASTELALGGPEKKGDAVMIHVTRDGDKILFDVKGLHKLWALKSRLEIPRMNIRGAHRDAAAVRGWKGWRVPGTYVPGLITAGTFYLEGKRIFWDVSDPDKAVVVELEDEKYNQLVIEVEDPDAVINLLTSGQ